MWARGIFNLHCLDVGSLVEAYELLAVACGI